MAIADTSYNATLREQLLDRRTRLEEVLNRDETAQMNHLLQEVDQALHRIDAGNFGVCEVCHDPIESDRLLTDPLLRVCLGCLSPAQQRALEYDLELAAQIQKGLLPSPDVHIPGWQVSYHFRPAGVVSGDYCDLLSDGCGGLHFVIADVAGKGVAAAMLAANLRAMFRALIPLNLGTVKLLEHASRLFCESKLPTQYATVVFGKITSAGELEIVNAGHLPALLVQGCGLSIFESSTLPLGMFCDQQFTASRALLAPGDTLVLYTDGISEAQNLAGEEYGNEAVKTLIQQKGLCCPENLIRACREHLDAFRGDCERHDDETLLAIQYEPTSNAASIV